MKRQDTRSILTEAQRLARHLPVLCGAFGVAALSVAGINAASHTMRALLGNGGDVTALLTTHAHGFTVAFAKAMMWGERVLAFLGF